VIALPSTAKGGSVSRIQPAFAEGASVVTTRGDVRYVVTEYGVADLWGKSVRERTMALIEIAHPQFRPELVAAAKQRRYVFADQLVPKAGLPRDATARVRLANGAEVLVRPVRMTDEEPLQRLFYELSNDSTYRRFMSHHRVHPHEEMQELVNLDYENNMGLVVCAPDRDDEIIAMARYDVDPATRLAEIAFVVRDDWQRKGLGTLLLRRMGEIARARGLPGFRADILAGNKPMLMVFHRSGLELRTRLEDGVYDVEAYFDGKAPPTPSPGPAPP
jgi:GNAT superfamily N-acetyltransferase